MTLRNRPFPEYEAHDATGLAQLVADGEVSSKELVETAIDRIEHRNPKLNAVIRTDYERARESAGREPEGVFGGVPTLHKDLLVELNEITSFGSVFFRSFRAEGSTPLTDRLLATGAVSVGRTNTPEFGLLPITEPVLYGATANPWDLDRSPGGSSGGAASAVAAGIVPLAHGGDGGGSIRIPASACGLFGLKVSRGRTPQYPPSPSDFLAVAGGLSRSVRDSARLLDAIAGSVRGSMYAVPPPETSFEESVESDPQALRIGVVSKDLRGEPLHPDCAAAMTATITALDELGHEVVEISLGIDAEAVEDAFMVVWSTLAESVFLVILQEAEKRRGGKLLRRTLGDWRAIRTIARLDERRSGLETFEPFTWQLAKRSRSRSPGVHAMARVALKEASFDLANTFEGLDAILTPSLGSPPVLTGEIDQRADWDDLIDQLARYVPHLALANFSGRPAMSVPLHWNAAQLPIGSHFIGHMGDESTLLGLAGQLEKARPWFDHTPELATV